MNLWSSQLAHLLAEKQHQSKTRHSRISLKDHVLCFDSGDLNIAQTNNASSSPLSFLPTGTRTYQWLVILQLNNFRLGRAGRTLLQDNERFLKKIASVNTSEQTIQTTTHPHLSLLVEVKMPKQTLKKTHSSQFKEWYLYPTKKQPWSTGSNFGWDLKFLWKSEAVMPWKHHTFFKYTQIMGNRIRSKSQALLSYFGMKYEKVKAG